MKAGREAGAVAADWLKTEAIPPGDNDPRDPSEALGVLVGLASGFAREFPPALLARHVRAIYGTTSWKVQRAAMTELRTRFAIARADALMVRERPTSRRILGNYRVGPKRASLRPYETMLRGLEPLDLSCDCIDFVRGSLGICKHGFAVLSDLGRRNRDFGKLLEQDRREAAQRPSERVRFLVIRPITGLADRFSRIELSTSFIQGLSKERGEILPHLERRKNESFGIASKTLASPPLRLEAADALRQILKSARHAQAIDPAARAVILEEADRHASATERGAAKAKLDEHRSSLNLKLLPYQQEGVLRFLESGRLLLADDMGLGKTAQAIAACHALYHAEEVVRGLVITPASLKGQWAREWARFSDVPLTIVEGSGAQRNEMLSRFRKGFLIINYELVRLHLEALKALNPDIVVLDEAQRIKNWQTQTAQTTKQLKPRFRLVLTGTPIENRFAEMASLLEWVGDDALEPAWRLDAVHRPTVTVVSGLDTLRLRMARSTLRRTRQEVLGQLPARRDHEISVPLTEAQLDLHEELRPFIARLAGIASHRPLTQPEFLRLMSLLVQQRIICNGLAQVNFEAVFQDLQSSRRPHDALLPTLASPKLEHFRELVRSYALEQNRKLVVFSQWRRMLHLCAWAVSDLLAAAGLESVFFTGEESSKKREANIVAFHDNPKTAVFFATDAGGVGLNLQRAADVCTNLDVPWNPAVLEQRIARIWRLGQKNPIDVINLIGTGGLEEKIRRLVSDKKAAFTGLFEGTTDTVQFNSASSFAASLRTLADPLPADEDEDLDDFAEPPNFEAEASSPLFIAPRDDNAVDALPTAAADQPGAAPSASTPLSAFSSIKVTHAKDGSITLKAPPEAAKHLADAFALLGNLLNPSK